MSGDGVSDRPRLHEFVFDPVDKFPDEVFQTCVVGELIDVGSLELGVLFA